MIGVPLVRTHARMDDSRTPPFGSCFIFFKAKTCSDRKLLFYDPPQFDPPASFATRIKSIALAVLILQPVEVTKSARIHQGRKEGPGAYAPQSDGRSRRPQLKLQVIISRYQVKQTR